MKESYSHSILCIACSKVWVVSAVRHKVPAGDGELLLAEWRDTLCARCYEAIERDIAWAPDDE